ncbi:MAG: hypothetical protein Q9225_005917 [Loekoesia sp. 1 TL-2023]
MRVQNNRKVNAGKKTWLDKGRQATHSEDAKKGRQGSLVSLEDDGFLGELGDEDAEGEIDEDYQCLPQHASQNQRPAAQDNNTHGPSSAPVSRPKQEPDSDDSDYIHHRAKKSKKSTSSTRRGPTNGSTRKQRAPPGSRSRYQAINGVMIDIFDRSREAMVYEQASPDLQARFTSIHYPNGRPSTNGRLFETNGSRRSSRAAAPTTFHGAENSDEAVNGDSGSHYEGTDDDCHQGARG